jgi:hypothetical protein
VVTGTSDQPRPVECPQQLTSSDAALSARQSMPPGFRGHRAERSPAQVNLGLEVVIRTERPDLDAAQ